MKTIKHMRYVLPIILLLSIPCILHAQVIRIEGNASIIISGEAKIVMDNPSLENNALIFNSFSTALVFKGIYDKTTLLADRNVQQSLTNVTVANEFAAERTLNNTLFIFPGKELFSKKTSTQTFLQAYPNPTTRGFTLTVSSDKSASDVILLQDGSGQIVERRRVYYRPGLNTITWDLDRYASGTYMVAFENTPGKYLKIVKQ